MMATIGSFEAKTKFSALLQRVERGEQIVITRRGKPVAKLVRIDSGSATRAADAVAQLKKLREGTTLGGLSWKKLRDEGRKY
jgi:prevent-host-death family protein